MTRYIAVLLASAALLLFDFAAQATPAENTVIGNFDGIFKDSDGNSFLSGWACAYGNLTSLTINVYASWPYPRGEYFSGIVANQPSESAVASSCGTIGANYRFSIPLSQQIQAQFSGEEIFIYGLSPAGGANALLWGSGNFIVPAPTSAPSCAVYDLTSLNFCMSTISSFQVLNFQGDVTCSGSSCCGTYGPLIDLDNQSYKVILGNGHTVRRLGNQTMCPVLSMSAASYITVSSLNFDENEGTAPCTPYQNCANAIQASNSSNLRLDGVGLYNAKAFGINVWANNTSGGSFNLINSVVSNTGIIGFYAGNGSYSLPDASNHIFVTDSTFSSTRTNAIAFQGVLGSQPGDNIIANNILNNNHYQGQWLDPNGLPIDGGQIYLPYVNYVTVANNVIADGVCMSCDNPMVWGFELGPEGLISNLTLADNYMYNFNGAAFFLNYGTNIDSSTEVSSNWVYGFTQFLSTAGGPGLGNATVTSDNTVGDLTPSLNRGGVSSYAIYRLNYQGLHEEANTVDERPGATLEGIFQLSPFPRLGASSLPIYRCFDTVSTINDFPSTDPNCEGQGHFHSILGYSYESTYSGVLPFYRCRAGGDHFVSWASNCEGQAYEGQLGFARPG